ncbi:M56 family metallopeptidase [Oscillatoriales cyanobacterium LEGE 11467]|uniref:M56 family metallopeptidase n=1 Tax=Zarconia navalis LEGE 11467 TaxID=1828826 RepID=A0A928VUP4_9CYAN|nr:M56 family metallopeptidase [Zarconia navalis]MBE9040572.1 M56 family metallopeptidase [Zarconia navalis LEGE 11467]
MHLVMILATVGLAWGMRLSVPNDTLDDGRRWQRALMCFLFSPLLLVATAVAIACMGTQGNMVGWIDGWPSYVIALGFLGFMVLFFAHLAREARRSLRRIRTYPQQTFAGKPGRLLDSTIAFSAQIGLWQPELVVSRGLLETLDAEHLEAVLAHERAHVYYRDTFCFFWLGWIRRCTAWLPNTEAWWQELLLLREKRADRWAARRVDPLLLAESLLLVVRSPLEQSESFCAAFSCLAPQSRLEERIDALLDETSASGKTSLWRWAGLLVALIPLLVVPFHT